MAKHFGALTDPTIYGPLITLAVFLGHGLSVPMWWNAGKNYERILTEKKLAAA